MLDKVSAVYPNTYRGMSEQQRANVIDEWYGTLQRYSVQLCRRGWERYKENVRLKELNLSLLVGMIKDVEEADRREEQRKALKEPEEFVRDEEWYRLRDECIAKCEKLFGKPIRKGDNNEHGYADR